MTAPWRDSELDSAEHVLVCSVCAAPITDDKQRTERGGAHEHTFANPHGYVHRVRCFAAAGGLAPVGPPENAFSWFPGYSWQIVDCARCHVHIGWIFRCAGDSFFGLVADRLVER